MVSLLTFGEWSLPSSHHKPNWMAIELDGKVSIPTQPTGDLRKQGFNVYDLGFTGEALFSASSTLISVRIDARISSCSSMKLSNF